MNLSQQLAKHFRQVYFGGNWTSVNMKDVLADINFKQATASTGNCNSIAKLVFHTNYYVHVATKVLRGEPLIAHDKYSFELPANLSEQDWCTLVDKSLAAAETFASLIENLPEAKWTENFADEKYGTYFRNITGIIEHTHYHLGQIALLKKILI